MVETYGQRVRAIRSRLGMTQKQLGEALGRTRGMVASVEIGAVRFGRDTERKLAQLAIVPRDYLTDAPLKAAE